jgi:hypothetical protein
MKPIKVDAIIAIDPDARVVVRNKTEVEWLDSNPNNISEDAIQKKWDELVAEYDAFQYQREREPDYPTLAEQFDLLWHAIDADTLDKTSDFYTTLKAVKDAHPKG